MNGFWPAGQQLQDSESLTRRGVGRVHCSFSLADFEKKFRKFHGTWYGGRCRKSDLNTRTSRRKTLAHPAWLYGNPCRESRTRKKIFTPFFPAPEYLPLPDPHFRSCQKHHNFLWKIRRISYDFSSIGNQGWSGRGHDRAGRTIAMKIVPEKNRAGFIPAQTLSRQRSRPAGAGRDLL